MLLSYARFFSSSGIERAALFAAPNASPPLDQAELTSIATKIEEYFRPSSFRIDRLAVALSFLWTSLSARYPEHAFLGLSAVLEALLSTQEQEVTHQLAERAALVLEFAGLDAVTSYTRVKVLYSTRSNIIHGRGATRTDWKRIRRRRKEGKQMGLQDISLLLHPMRSVVPARELEELRTLAVNLIRLCLWIDRFYAVVRQSDDAELDRLFLTLLLGSRGPEKTSSN